MAGSPAPEDVVRQFLADVRAGRHPDRAARYLSPRVTAHQGRPGAVHSVVTRTPEEYADHVREMLAAVGPWVFDVETVQRADDLVTVTWRQRGTVRGGPQHGRPVVEHGRATYRVDAGLIAEYWIEFTSEVGPPDRRGGSPCPADRRSSSELPPRPSGPSESP